MSWTRYDYVKKIIKKSKNQQSPVSLIIFYTLYFILNWFKVHISKAKQARHEKSSKQHFYFDTKQVSP